MEETEYEARQTLAKGIQAALARIPGSSRLKKCARIGVSANTLDKWITGANAPSEQNLARLARLSGMDQETIRNGGQEREYHLVRRVVGEIEVVE